MLEPDSMDCSVVTMIRIVLSTSGRVKKKLPFYRNLLIQQKYTQQHTFVRACFLPTDN